jgi:hypothetical protein
LLNAASTLLGACVTDASTEPDFTTPGSISIISGNGQSTNANQPLAAPLLVQVLTPDSAKCNGCRVEWDLVPGGFSEGVVVGATNVVGQTGLQISGIGSAGTYSVIATIDSGAAVQFSLVVH